MKRKIMNELIEWKKCTDKRMPLLLYGARQTGKTYILRKFGEACYDNTIYINFERMTPVAEFFAGDLAPSRIIRLLEEFSGQKIRPATTLLIFDEVQACERALTSLKYFCEEAPYIHVAAAGSLLGVAIHRGQYSFPVGKVIMKTLYPLTFDEFLDAAGESHLVTMIRECYEEMKEMPAAAHQTLNDWYKRYLITGGMPAAVNEYLKETSLTTVADVQDMILSAYAADMTKYATEGESVRIRGAFYSMPAQLAKENRKFQYKLIRKGASASLFGESIDWLLSSGVVLSCDRVTRPELPLSAFRDLSAFKLYLSDVGLLSAFARIMPEDILRGTLSDTWRGAVAENYAAQAMKANGHTLYYWTNDSPQAEVDFVIQCGGSIVPVEVKSGERVRSRSLALFHKQYAPDRMIRLSEKNFGREGPLYAIPLYAAFCIGAQPL